MLHRAFSLSVLALGLSLSTALPAGASSVTGASPVVERRTAQVLQPQGAGLYTGPSVLKSGKTLALGAHLVSPDTQYFSYLGTKNGATCLRDGYSVANLNLGYSYCMVSATGANRLVMQADGNLVAYTSANKSVWSTGTAGHAGATLVIGDDGILAVVSSSGSTLWSTVCIGNDFLLTSNTLPSGWRLDSGPNDQHGAATRHSAVMQTNGDLVYFVGSSVRWHSNTAGHPGAHLVFSNSGDLRVILAGVVLWHSNTAGKGSITRLTNDYGSSSWRFDVENSAGTTFWSVS